ncbi:MAG: BamA/TamA family outer membrane protein, partial [Bacteroidia bacterium]|nr:BamA/TamA family outer membrane protein [Bacteroidia bacterium]
LIDSVSYFVNGEPFSEDGIFTPSLLSNNCFVKKGSIYRIGDVESTNTRFRSLPIINNVSTRFTEVVDSLAADDYGHLAAMININTSKQQDYSIDVEGTNSSGNLGGAVSLSHRHLNLFRGAESLKTRVRFALQNQFARDGKERFMTLEFSASTDLTFPKLFFPYVTERFHKRRAPQTIFNIAYDYQRRPDFTKSQLTSHMRYTWHGSKYVLHTLTPVEFNVVKIPAISEEFKSYISKSYLQYSYQDHFIFSLGYSFLFNQQVTKKLGTTWYVRLGIETAGNALSLFDNVMHKVESEDDTYNKLIGIRYAQYAKTDIEVRCQVTDLWMNSWVYRVFIGAGVPYGNSKMLPFEKSYFVGGANSIRAWPIRGLGPGTVVPDKSVRYHNQTSDMHLEMNAEYRFHIVSALEGAVFADAGNIWALNSSTSDEGAKISKDFYKQIALGGGLGIRLNFDFFVVRLDGAVKLHDPMTLDRKRGWIIADRAFKAKDINLNFAIGYPF